MDASPTIPRLPVNLGDGLRLRRATPADGEALAAFNFQIHENHPDRPPDHRLETWVRDLVSGRHPTFRVEDFTLVEDQSSGKIVSSANLISQVWSYAGIPFRVGRPELVGTDPQYRNRGLVRKQFDVLHAWSAARGELAQAITGIPYYYRLFGYEMAVDLGGGRQYAIPQQIPKLKEGASEPFLIRPAVEADLPFLAACYRQGRDRWLLSADWDEDLLRYELLGKHPDNINRVVLEVIERPAGEAVGFFTHPAFLLGSPERTAVTYLELLPGTSWYAAVPAVMRYMVRLGQQMVTAEKKERLDAVELHLGPEHPAYDVLAYHCTADPRPYTWYLRVPDLPRFINFAAPAIERRLAGSLCPGYSGTLDISFYRGSGLRLTLENGQLSAAPISRYWEDGAAAFPGLTFLQLLFGYRSIGELRATYPDCWFDRELEPVFDALFPRRPSLVWPVS